MLELRGLEVSYGAVKALDGVSMTVEPATITAVIGANGAGKTTLLRTVSGLVRASRGAVCFEGRDLTTLPPEVIAMLGVAHVPQGGGVIGELTVKENLRLGGLCRTRGRAQLTNDAGIYELFPPLRSRSGQHGFSLSGGERQMLAIGRALMADPTLLLLDEPSLGLAPMVVAQIMSLLRRLRDESGLAVVVVEQNARSALSVADRAVVLNLGRVVKAGEASAISADEGLRHAYLGF